MKDCTTVVWKYTRFFCGNSATCKGESRGFEAKGAAAEIAKKRILRDYFLVGILEQFEDTLSLFQKLLPQFFTGAREAARSEFAKIGR